MFGLSFLSILLLATMASGAQQNVLALKKGNKTTEHYWKGQFIAFQLQNKEWRKGEITAIRNDSVYIRPRVIHYNLYTTDTAWFNIEGYALTDIYALPKKGYLIDYKNGRFQYSGSGGHVHWYWVKSGWLFRTAGLGYAGLNILNGAINNDLSLKDPWPYIATGLFSAGVLLKHLYKPWIRMGKKNRLQVIQLN
ncbi:MAG: hypothetical protein U0U70_02020 [Chitinophagaceae bacterium]